MNHPVYDILKKEGLGVVWVEAAYDIGAVEARIEELIGQSRREYVVFDQRVVEIAISRTLRSDTSCPTMIPPSPEPPTTGGESVYVQDGLDEVESVLSRLHWLLEDGTLPLEDRTQVRRIASWGDAFYRQTRRMYRSGSFEDASELVQAAHSVAQSAEHICRNWYVARALDPRVITAAPQS